MTDRNLNFTRLWMFEHRYGMSYSAEPIVVSPHPYKLLKSDDEKRTTQFDLNQWNEEYFTRLKERIEIASENGIYVSVMLFQGWSLDKTGTASIDPWVSNYMNPANNIQKIGAKSGKVDSDTEPTVHSLMNPELLAFQLKYVDKVIETVNGFDNVLYEILNEGGAIDWIYYMIHYIRQKERNLPKQHPIGMSHRVSPRMLNADLENSPADWIAPADEPMDWMYPGSSFLDDMRYNLSDLKSNKVVILDTDHLWGCGGNYEWAWKAFLQGYNPIFMDPWDGLLGADTVRVAWLSPCAQSRNYVQFELLRKNLGITRQVAQELDLKNCKPMPQLVSSRFCLANPGESYVVWVEAGKNLTINLFNAIGEFSVTWYNPVTLKFMENEPIRGGDYCVLQSPDVNNMIAIIARVNK